MVCCPALPCLIVPPHPFATGHILLHSHVSPQSGPLLQTELSWLLDDALAATRGQAASGPAPAGSSWSGSCAGGRRRRARALPGSLCSCGSRSPGWVSPALRCTECVLVSFFWTSDVSGDLSVVLVCAPCRLPLLLATLFGCRGDVGAAAGAAHTPAVPHRHRVLAGRCAVRCCLRWAQLPARES
jgi:hypothetical protein